MDRFFNIGLFILFLIIVGNSSKVIFEDCGSTYDIKEIDITGCSRSVPCYLYVGVPANVTVSYKASFSSKNLSQTVYIDLNNIHYPPKVAPSACEATWCPVNALTTMAYEATMELPYPIVVNTRGNLVWSVYNEFGSKVLCFDVVVQTRKLFNTFNETEPQFHPRIQASAKGDEE